MTTFIDSSAIYAFLDRRDANHPRAEEAWQRLLDNEVPLLTHSYVLLEIIALLQHRLGLAAVRALHEDLAPLLQIHWIGEAQHQAAVAAVLAAAKRKLSVVDWASFQVMRENGVRAVFCFDQHFRDQGFDVIP